MNVIEEIEAIAVQEILDSLQHLEALPNLEAVLRAVVAQYLANGGSVEGVIGILNER